MNESTWSHRISVMTRKRSASTLRTAPWPCTRRPSGSGPRAIRKVQSSAKNSMMRSTSRLLNAALMSARSAGVGPAAVAVVMTLPAFVMGELLEGQPAARHAARRRGPLRVDVAEGDQPVQVHRGGHAQQRAQLALRDVGRARADTLAPGDHHHVLRAASGVVLVPRRLRDDDDRGGLRDPARLLT